MPDMKGLLGWMAPSANDENFEGWRTSGGNGGMFNFSELHD
jgi:hypothetical protein